MLIKRFTEIQLEPEKFPINKVILISKKNIKNEVLLQELREEFIRKIYNNCKNFEQPDVDFCHKYFEKYFEGAYFTIKINDKEKVEIHHSPSLSEIIEELKEIDAYLDDDEFHFKESLLNRVLITTDDSGNFLTGGSILEHLHGEITYRGKTYFFLDGEWYQIHENFIRDLNDECNEILHYSWDESLISTPFDLAKKESKFNLGFLGKVGWLVFDTVTPDNIEACDLLQYDDHKIHLIHVKKGFDNSIRELASQISIAAKRIRQDLKTGYSYIEDLELQTKNGIRSNSITIQNIAKQIFPTGGLKEIFKNKVNNQIIFCLAFVDTAKEKRCLKQNVSGFQSNIAKYSLFELSRELRLLGFGFKVIQLSKK